MTDETKKVSEARRKANNKWDSVHLETMGISLKYGVKGKIKAICSRSGETMISFILSAIQEKAIREGILTEEQASTLLDEDHEGAWIRAYLSE